MKLFKRLNKRNTITQGEMFLPTNNLFLSPFNHDNDCYQMKTGKCVFELFTKDEIGMLPSRKRTGEITAINECDKKIKICDLIVLETDTNTISSYLSGNKEKDKLYLRLLVYIQTADKQNHDCLRIAYSLLKNEYVIEPINQVNIQVTASSDIPTAKVITNGRHGVCIAQKLHIQLIGKIDFV